MNGRDRHVRLALEKKGDLVSTSTDESIAELVQQLENPQLTDAEIAKIDRKLQILTKLDE